ncbi:MAG TPA: hypothetical protein V6D09_05105 [Leptolyngbyaceae cyanobacterium]
MMHEVGAIAPKHTITASSGILAFSKCLSPHACEAGLEVPA